MTMREGFPDFQPAIDLEFLASIGERVDAELAVLDLLAVVVGGEGATVEDVFPLPTTVRKDAPTPEWANNEAVVAKVRETAHAFGYGAEQDTQSGLRGGRRVLRGGLYWKIAAEEAALVGEADVADVTFSGSPNRKLNDAERTAIRADIEELSATLEDMPAQASPTVRSRLSVHRDRLEQLTHPDVTEYDMVTVFALRRADVVPDDIYALPYGYEIEPGNKILVSDEPTGQYVHVGTAGGQNIRVLRVDQKMYPGAEPDKEVRSQPDTASLLEFVSFVADGEGAPTDAIAVVDSNTYAASVIEAVRASLRDGQHQFGVVMYGRQTLARVKRTELQADMPLNQVPGELRARHISLTSLQAEIAYQAFGSEEQE